VNADAAACSITRAPILSSRWRNVANSQRASGLVRGKRNLIACMS
jgi:hypothetical protein